MPKKVFNSVAAMATVLLVACGGNDAQESTSGQPASETPTLEAQYQALLTQANAAKAEAEAHAQSGPCTSDAQCATLVFRSPLAPCFDTTTLDYSTASENAAVAEAAAARYATAAAQAEAIAPPSNVSGSCFTNVDLTPLACIDNRCQRGFVFGGPAASGT